MGLWVDRWQIIYRRQKDRKIQELEMQMHLLALAAEEGEK